MRNHKTAMALVEDFRKYAEASRLEGKKGDGGWGSQAIDADSCADKLEAWVREKVKQLDCSVELDYIDADWVEIGRAHV